MAEESTPGPDGDAGAASRSPPRPAPTPLDWEKFKNILTTRKIDVALWVTRLFTLVFGFLYLFPFPIFGNATNYYYKTMIASAATSALRLHQRLPPFQFSQAFLAQLVMEDSFHYLCYAVIFIVTYPMTLSILPVLLFALLHLASFSLVLLDALGRYSGWIARILISIVELQAISILRLIACSEILMFPAIIFYIFCGKLSIFTPILYYRFLTFRYSSRRNHYTKTMFAEFRMQFQALANSPKCPRPIATLIYKGINLVIYLAPPVAPPTPTSN